MRTALALVIMAGGRGERLWPLVRTNRPKVCVSADGTQSLLEVTLRRLQPLARKAEVLIVTTAPQAQAVRRVLPSAYRRSLLVEPQAKNTAACIALAAAAIAQRDPMSVMAVLPSDHWIEQTTTFQQSLCAAIEMAHVHDQLVTIGIRPTRVHPGLGYLCADTRLGNRRGCRVFRMRRFVEKPSPRIAQQLVQHRTTYWNTGVFVGQAIVFLESIHRWLPNHARLVFPLGHLVGRSSFARKASSAYRRLRAMSFDHGVMGHLRDGYVVEGRFEWEDLGSWDSWLRIGQRTQPTLTIASRNVRVVSADGERCRVCGTGQHLVATVGLNDVLVVHTRDATLICRTQQAQAVRSVAARVAHDRTLSRYA